MRVLFDTSVVVPALVGSHPRHARSLAWLAAVSRGKAEGVMSWHGMAEAWAVLTRLPLQPAISAATARLLLERVERAVSLRGPDRKIYQGALERCVSLGLRSGAVFDAIHMVTAEAASAEVLLTWNVQDFLKLGTSARVQIVTPDSATPG